MPEFLLKPIVGCRSHDKAPFLKHNILSPSSLVTTWYKRRKSGGIFSYDFSTDLLLNTFTVLRLRLAVFPFALVANYLELSTSPADEFL